jgi:hypothetical protein
MLTVNDVLDGRVVVSVNVYDASPGGWLTVAPSGVTATVIGTVTVTQPLSAAEPPCVVAARNATVPSMRVPLVVYVTLTGAVWFTPSTTESALLAQFHAERWQEAVR